MSSVRSNRNFIVVFAVVAALMLVYGIANFKQAFPEIGIDFKVPRQTALYTAEEFLKSRHFDLTGYKKNIQFTAYWGNKVYMERELGVERLISLAQDSIDTWFWNARFFKPLTKLEYRVKIDPKGRLIGFEREVDEDAPAPTLDSLAAQTLAEAFIGNVMKVEMTEWDLVEKEFTDRPARRDWTFTYEKRDFKVKDAPYRIWAGVQGAEVSRFSRSLRVPPDWWRNYERQRSQNELFQNIANFFAFATGVLIFITFLKHIKVGQIPWRATIIISIVLAAATFLAGLNSLPLTMSFYQTTSGYWTHLAMMILFSLLSGAGQGLLLMLLLGAGERLYRQDYPNKMYLPAFFTRRGFASREMFQATLVGYLLAAFHIGFVVLFYVVGRHLGFWSPADVKYNDAVTTWIPWIYPLAVSMGAALLEEFWFRLWGISFFKKLTKSTILALIIPAFIWGFLHSAYPQQPGYVRGIEVGLIGIVAGIVMLRFGIWATLTWHFVIDAIFIGLFLFRSSNAYFWISGLIVCGFLLAPAVAAIVVYLKRHRLEPADDLLNRVYESPVKPILPGQAASWKPAGVEAPAAPLAAEPTAYKPLSAKARRAAVMVGIAGIITLSLPGPRRFGEDFSVKIDREQALVSVKQVLRERYNIEPDTFLISGYGRLPDNDFADVLFGDDESSGNWTLSYLKKHTALERAEEVYLTQDKVGEPRWGFSFKRPLDPVTYGASVSKVDGRPWVNKNLPDSAAGADLALDSARMLATAAFEAVEQEPQAFVIKEERSAKRPNRRDWYFTWEAVDSAVGKAHFRRAVNVIGDQVQQPSDNRYLKLPEEWTRSEKKMGARGFIIMALNIIVMLGAPLLIIINLGKRFKRREIEWRAGIIIGITAAVFTLIGILNDLTMFWSNYSVNIPAANFLTAQIIANIIAVIMTFFIALVMISVTEALVKGKYNYSPWTGLGRGETTAQRDGAAVALGVMGVLFGLNWLLNGLTGWLNLPLHTWSLNIPNEINQFSPWLGEFKEVLNKSITTWPMALAVFVLLSCGIKKVWLRTLIIAVGTLGILSKFTCLKGNLTTGEFIWCILQGWIWVAVMYYIFARWVQGRLWALIAAVFIVGLVNAGSVYIGWQGSPYNIQGLVLLFLAALAAVKTFTPLLKLKS